MTQEIDKKHVSCITRKKKNKKKFDTSKLCVVICVVKIDTGKLVIFKKYRNIPVYPLQRLCRKEEQQSIMGEQANPVFLVELVGMGFDEGLATTALIATNNISVDAALDLLLNPEAYLYLN